MRCIQGYTWVFHSTTCRALCAPRSCGPAGMLIARPALSARHWLHTSYQLTRLGSHIAAATATSPGHALKSRSLAMQAVINTCTRVPRPQLQLIQQTLRRPAPAAVLHATWLLQRGHAATVRLNSSSSHLVTTLCTVSSGNAATAAPVVAVTEHPYVGKELPGCTTEVPDTSYCVVNFYHLVDISDPKAVVERHRRFLEGKDVRGRIYISTQGINAQFGGLSGEAIEYTLWVSQQPEFQQLRFSLWPAKEHMYPKLRLKFKPNLISLAGGMTSLPITEPITSRARPLQPEQWKEMLQQAKQLREQSDMAAAAPQQKIVVLDVRNDYEWDAGHFQGASRPAEEVFHETPVGEGNEDVPEPLAGADPDTPVMMYCTGGIRCDVYSAFLKQKGFKNLYTLEGGIQNYLVKEGGDLWNGSLFVFDGRMAIPPGVPEEGAPLPAAVPCQLCGSAPAQLPHVNCANIDCNELFVACTSCKSRWSGCCSEACTCAPRLLRPAKLEGGQYGAWGNYADGEEFGRVMATGRSHEGRVARRARRREAFKERRQRQLLERQDRKQMVRDAMAKLALAEQQQKEQQQQQQPIAV